MSSAAEKNEVTGEKQQQDSVSTDDVKQSAVPQQPTEKSELNVKSANDWEHANLGDDARKEKFLKLMGAAKDDHKGKIVIGEDNTPKHKGDDPDKMNQKLEEQFERGLEHKLKSGYKGHLGLGFQKEEKSGTATPESTGVDATPDTDKKEETYQVLKDKEKESQSKESPAAAAEKRKSTADADSTTSSASNGGSNSEAAVPPKKKKSMMMNFVKASDS